LRWNGGVRVRAQSRIGLPPVESDLLGLVDRANEKSNLYSEELDVGEVDLDVSNHHQALVENAVENIDETVGTRRAYQVCQAVVSVRLVRRVIVSCLGGPGRSGDLRR